MKKCLNYETCNNMCDDNYKYCLECAEKWEKKKEKGDTPLLKKLDEIQELLQKINWNIGASTKYLRLYFLYQICTKISGREPEDMKEKIYRIFKKNIEKDFKHLDDIEKELKKK